MGAKMCCDEQSEGEPALVAVVAQHHGSSNSKQPPVEPQDLDEAKDVKDMSGYIPPAPILEPGEQQPQSDIRISTQSPVPEVDADGRKFFKVNITKGAGGQQKLGLVVYWSQKSGTLMVKTLKPGVVADWNSKNGNIITEGCVIASVNGETNPHRMADTLDEAQTLQLRMILPSSD
mmetsp:Transcript_69639/g.167120  ORF Transcript_69639/g.167120 Transcript_69639/m.167120 type:complete len:176 (-) Transcript_69639:121-648(-)